jgi:hypothetical protein
MQTVPRPAPEPAALETTIQLPEARSIADSPPGPASLTSWAVEEAGALLRMGQSVPEIEQRLVARGLTPAAAAAAVRSALEERARAPLDDTEEAEPGDRVHRILSALVGCVCLVLAYSFGEGLSAAKTLISILGPLACIWFPEILGRSPLSRWAGWFVLLLICGYRVVLLIAAPH